MSTICGKYNQKTKTRCTRGAAHVDNGMPHADNNGNQWRAGKVDKAFAHLPPKRQLISRVRAAVRTRIERIAETDDENYCRMLNSFIGDVVTAALHEINEERRNLDQKPLICDIKSSVRG